MTLGIILLLAAAFSAGYLIQNIARGVTGQAVAAVEKQNYSWTTAICNNNKECIDVVIFCEQGTVTHIQPISNLTQFTEQWHDPRNKVTRYCE